MVSLAMPLAATVEAHPARVVAAKLDVRDGGKFRLLLTFDLPAFALNERPGDVQDATMLALLDGPDAELRRYLDDARKRLERQLTLSVDGRAVETTLAEFPDVAEVRRLDSRDPKVPLRLPILADVLFTGRLPAGAEAASVRFPRILGDVVLTAEVPGREPQGQLVTAGEAGEALDVAPAAPPTPPTTRPACGG